MKSTLLSEFCDRLSALHEAGVRAVIGLDEIEMLIRLRQEFSRDFCEALRSIAQLGHIAVMTTSRSTLRQLHDEGALVSPLFNIMGAVMLEELADDEARELVASPRPGVAFTGPPIDGILERGRRHPLRLQILCWHVAQAASEQATDWPRVWAEGEAETATWTDRFISARRLRVSFLTPDEVRPLLTMPIPEFDLTYEPGALEAIIDASRGQPFLTQAVAFELVQYMNEKNRKEAGCADVQEAIRRAFESGGEYFADVWSDAGKQGQEVLLAAVAHDPLPDLPDARRWLIDHDVLGDDGQFLVPMMERWVREQIVDARRSLGSRR